VSELYDHGLVVDLAAHADPWVTFTASDGRSSVAMRDRTDIARSVLDRLIELGWRSEEVHPVSERQEPRIQINAENVQLVGFLQGAGVVQVMYLKAVMTPDEALQHAAWLVAVAEAGNPAHTFEEHLAAVRST
jgi:hypothetical protein